ncbi:MAG: hypothetical protein ACRDQ1_01335 [Sciscionella sp.]
MSWTDFYRRRDAIDAVLTYAERHNGALGYHALPEVRAVFTGEEELLLALHYKWNQILLGSVSTALLDAAQDSRTDDCDAVIGGWRRAARASPALRRLLDAHLEFSPAVRAAHDTQLRMLATSAGLTRPGEATAEVTRIGGAFLALAERTPAKAEPGRGGFARLRRLAATA